MEQSASGSDAGYERRRERSHIQESPCDDSSFLKWRFFSQLHGETRDRPGKGTQGLADLLSEKIEKSFDNRIMELKEFIKAAITDITDAISELQNELGNNAVVSPPMPSPIALKTLQQEGKNRLISDIDFNVAITVGSVDSMEGNAGAGILQVFSAKVNAGNESRSEKVSRISFSIPVIYPTAEVKTDREP